MENRTTFPTTIKNLVTEILWRFKDQPYTTTRWAWMQLLFSVAFFLIALALGIIALAYSIHGVFNMPGLVVAGLIVSGIAVLVGFIIAALAVHMGYYWYSSGHKDPTATKGDIEKAVKAIKTEIRMSKKGQGKQNNPKE